MSAAKEYLGALNRLGLRPLFLGWGLEAETGRWVLGLVASIVEAGGPLALNRLLFRAYNANATPKDISPFIVRVYSPEIAPRDFYLLSEKTLTISSVEGDIQGVEVNNVEFDFLGVHYEMINACFIPQRIKRPKYQETRAEWQRFKRNVEKLAA
jgi:hypothetical protein